MTTDTLTNDTDQEREPGWDPDEHRRWVEGQRQELTKGQETAARTSSWWSEVAATLAKIRKEAPSHFPSTPNGWEEWYQVGGVVLHVDKADLLAFLDSLVAASDSIAADFRREGDRLRTEQKTADEVNGAHRAAQH